MRAGKELSAGSPRPDSGARGVRILEEEPEGEREMTPPSPALQSTARRLIEDAAAGDSDPIVVALAAEQVFRRLHAHLATLIGVVGFEMLLTRALKLARARLPALSAIEVTPAGTIAGLAEAVGKRTPAEAFEVPVTLLAQFIQLLAAFVGDDLALHLVSEAVQRDDERGPPSEPEDTESAKHGSSEDR